MVTDVVNQHRSFNAAKRKAICLRERTELESTYLNVTSMHYTSQEKEADFIKEK